MRYAWLLVFLSGCGSTPYLELGGGYQAYKGDYIISQTVVNEFKGGPSQVINGEFQYELDCAQFSGAAGFEWDNNWSVEYQHLSCIDPTLFSEQRMDNFMVKKRWYGRKQR